MPLPEELSASLQKVTIHAEAKESTSQRQLEQLQQSFESYKKKTKAATSLLQEKNSAMGEEMKKLADEVSVRSGHEW